LNLLSLYCHTLSYLKPQQIYRRIWFRFTKPRLDYTPAPVTRHQLGPFCSPARRAASLLDADTFYLLNQSGALSTLGWVDIAEAGSHSKLWRYNQHYFNDLNAFNSAARKDWHLALMQRWVAENELGSGIGWESYPTSLCIVNWVKWQCCGYGLPDACMHSLAVQARWLMRRLERHILGNHLFANAKALVFAGCFFSGNEADDWLQQGMRIIRNELLSRFCLMAGILNVAPCITQSFGTTCWI